MTQGKLQVVTDDVEQLRLDLQDARLRFEHLREAMAAHKAAEARVVDLARQLRQAKRLAKEAKWKIELLLSRERQS